MKPVPYLDAMAETTARMADGGVFLSVGGARPNTMTIGWGTIGYFWKRPIFLAPVRESRHTLGILEKTGCFTVSVPTRAPLRAQLAFAGTRSGRDLDKFDGHGLTAQPAAQLDAPVVAECGLHFECRVLLRQLMSDQFMHPEIVRAAYPSGDLHWMFFGEILTCYRTD